MTRADDRRVIIVERLADHVLAHGLSAASLRPLAQAAGLSDRMLLYYFTDKADVMTAVFDALAVRLTAILDASRADRPLAFDALQRQVCDLVLDDILWPYMCLWLDIAALSARADPFYRAVGERIARGFLAWGASQLDSTAPAVDAARLLVAIEGSVLLKSLGLEAEARTAY